MNTSGDEAVIFEQRAYDDPVVQGLVAEVQAEYVRRYGSPDDAPIDVAQFTPPNGVLLIGTASGVPVAMGGWRTIDFGDGVATVEIKRMYVPEAGRRRGLARRILRELEAYAVVAGAKRAVLETGDQQPEAIALYESSGYLRREPFGYYADSDGSVHFTKDL